MVLTLGGAGGRKESVIVVLSSAMPAVAWLVERIPCKVEEHFVNLHAPVSNEAHASTSKGYFL